MAVLGMRGSGAWSSNERPENFRDKILFLYPNSPAILTAITGRLKSEVTNDPVFHIFEKGLPPMRAKIDQATTETVATAAGTTTTACTRIYLDTAADSNPDYYFRNGHVAIVERTQEVLWITASGKDSNQANKPYIDVNTRGGNATVDDKAALPSTQTDYVLIIGTRNSEGGDVPSAITHDATVVSNYTQIFRNSMHLTGTAKETYIRTGEISKEMQRMTAERHAIEMEWAAIFGKKKQATVATGGTGLYERTTQGFIERIGTTNVSDFQEIVTKAAWESFLEDLFLVPNSKDEKLCLCGNRALTTLNAMAQAYGHIGLVPTSETYGLKLMRWETPYGTLMLKGHALLSQNPAFNDWGLVVDTSNVVYRPLKNRDTKFLKDRQGNGVDAIIHEYLTEAGFEFRHASTHGLFKNAAAFQA